MFTGSLLAAVLFPTAGARAQIDPRPLPVVRVGVVIDWTKGGDPELQGIANGKQSLELIRQEIAALTHDEFDVRFPDDKLLGGNWTMADMRAALDRLLADPEVDLVLTIGVFSSALGCQTPDLPKPLVATAVVDADLQGLPFERGTTSVHNLNYVTIPQSVVRDLRRFHELVGFSKVHILHDPLAPVFFPNLYPYAQAAVTDLGAVTIPVPMRDTDTASSALALLPADAEAVYLPPLPRMSHSEYAKLIAGLRSRRLPSFALAGRQDVLKGVLAGVAPESNLLRLARRVALNVQRILLGEDAGTLPVILEQPEHLVINMDTARAIGWYPNWRVLTEAERIETQATAGLRKLNLAQAVQEAIARNLNLQAVDRGVAAGAEEVKRARSVLLPQLDVAISGTRVDKDRARTSLGNQAQNTVTGASTLSQILYSDEARGNLTVQHRLQDARGYDRESVRLDVALEASVGFLNVLRAQTLDRVEEENLRLTESNLELARRRQALGVSGPADVYRWESQLAADRRDVIAANRRVDAVIAAFNRSLNLPLEQRFIVVEPQLDDPELRSGRGTLRSYVDNSRSFEIFRNFMVQEGIENAPELMAFDAAIAAQERELVIARRSFWSPELSLFGEFAHDIDESGVGSVDDPLPFGLPRRNDTDWSVGIIASLPLFEGGARNARLSQAIEELAQLRKERQAAAETVELRVRTALYRVATSSPAIDLNRESAAAADRNLELVTDQYSQGVVSIIDLLDAQRNALVTEQLAANSVYDFLLDLMDLQRSSANFDFFLSDDQRRAWYERLDAFFKESQKEPAPSGR